MTDGEGEGCSKVEHRRQRYREWKADRDAGISHAPVPCGPVRVHVEKLLRDGLRPSTISKASGVSVATLSRILNGTAERCAFKTQKAILAVDSASIYSEAEIDGALLPTEAVREHIAVLLSQGFNQSAIRNVVGVNPSTMSAIVTGKQRTCEASVARAILALTYAEIFASASGKIMVPSYPTRRRFEALAALGWGARDLDRVAVHNRLPRLGRKGVESKTQDLVTADTHHKTALMYRHVSAHEEGGPSDRTREHAARSGWRKPEEWRDIDAPDLDVALFVPAERGDEVALSERRIECVS